MTVMIILLIMTHQMLLLMKSDSETHEDLLQSISGIFFVGCLHDEDALQAASIAGRLSCCIAVEYGSTDTTGWDRLYYFASQRSRSWAEAITEKFRQLRISFPVQTYQESRKTFHGEVKQILKDKTRKQIVSNTKGFKPHRSGFLTL